ncbi:MAG: hypothetical protein WBD10_00060, partial [Acidobacteriaceae bacterium]
MNSHRGLQILLSLAAAVGVILGCDAQALENLHAVTLTTSDVRIQVSADAEAPRLVSLSGRNASAWRNLHEETLPAFVERNGTRVPIQWKLKPELCSADARQVVFVYDSENPHLRLRWKWKARAAFGPLEHVITVENLSGREFWLPMVDSLRLDWQTPANVKIRNFYVEKGANTPSPQGVHLEKVA